MNWLTIAWSMCGAACAMLGLLHLLLWWKDHGNQAYMLSAVMALGAAGNAITELILFNTQSVATYASLLKWGVLFVYIILMSIVWFVYLQLGTARRWLAGAISLVWTIALVINFVSPSSLIYLHIDSVVHHETFLGESFSVALGTPNPWNELANFGVLLILVYTVDAALRSWRQGVKGPAVLVGGSIVTFLLFGGIHSILVDHGVIATPYMVSFAFLAIVAALSYELVSNAVRVRHYAQQLALGEERWQAFLANIELAVVGIDAAGNVNFVNPFLERITGYTSAKLIGRPARELVVPAERQEFASRMQAALQTGPRLRSEWTLLSATGEQRRLLWSTVRLDNPECSAAGFFSIGEDITELAKTQEALHNTQNEMEHLARANMLGELTSALAHELNQPLAAILSNAQAARRFMAHDPPDMEELHEIIEDIIRDDKRAGQVIRSLRDMLRKGEIEREQFSLNEAIAEVLQLLKAELEGQHVLVDFEAQASLPPVLAGRVEIQQVIMNLVVNAIHAMRELPAERRHLRIRTQVLEDEIVTTIQDSGHGIKKNDLPHVFDAFFTRRSGGLGIGLAICRRIIAAHGGEIRVANARGGGAELSFSLPTSAA